MSDSWMPCPKLSHYGLRVREIETDVLVMSLDGGQST
jgi:hypothetical protein